MNVWIPKKKQNGPNGLRRKDRWAMDPDVLLCPGPRMTQPTTLYATHRAPHSASGLVQAKPVSVVDENRTCSVPTFQTCQGLWSCDYGPACNGCTPSRPPHNAAIYQESTRPPATPQNQPLTLLEGNRRINSRLPIENATLRTQSRNSAHETIIPCPEKQ